MIYIVEYPRGDKSPRAWCAETKQQAVSAIAAALDMPYLERVRLAKALEFNAERLAAQDVFRSTREAIEALDDPRVWRDPRGAEALKLVLKENGAIIHAQETEGTG